MRNPFTTDSPAGLSRPEPVMDAAKITAALSGLVTAVGSAVILGGVATATKVQEWTVVSDAIVAALVTLLSIVLPLVTAKGARAQVTPLSQPQGVDNAPLIHRANMSGFESNA